MDITASTGAGPEDASTVTVTYADGSQAVWTVPVGDEPDGLSVEWVLPPETMGVVIDTAQRAHASRWNIDIDEEDIDEEDSVDKPEASDPVEPEPEPVVVEPDPEPDEAAIVDEPRSDSGFGRLGGF